MRGEPVIGSGSCAAVGGTARILLFGTLVSAACFLIGLGLTIAGAPAAAAIASGLGVVALLLTPAVGLVASAFEMRRAQPRAALMAVAVLAVLGVAALVALLAH